MSSFDLHEHRHALKQVRDSGDVSLWERRGELACPACEQPFSRLFITRRETTRFPGTDGAPFCLLRTDDSVLVFRH